MIYIQKRRTPAVVSMKAKELIKAPENNYSAISLPKDSGKLRHLFDQMQKDIDQVLVLNGKKDEEGKIIFDTATKLVAKQRSIYDSVCTQFERWDRKKCLTVAFLKDKISYLEKQLEGDEKGR